MYTSGLDKKLHIDIDKYVSDEEWHFVIHVHIKHFATSVRIIDLNFSKVKDRETFNLELNMDILGCAHCYCYPHNRNDYVDYTDFTRIDIFHQHNDFCINIDIFKYLEFNKESDIYCRTREQIQDENIQHIHSGFDIFFYILVNNCIYLSNLTSSSSSVTSNSWRSNNDKITTSFTFIFRNLTTIINIFINDIEENFHIKLRSISIYHIISYSNINKRKDHNLQRTYLTKENFIITIITIDVIDNNLEVDKIIQKDIDSKSFIHNSYHTWKHSNIDNIIKNIETTNITINIKSYIDIGTHKHNDSGIYSYIDILNNTGIINDIILNNLHLFNHNWHHPDGHQLRAIRHSQRHQHNGD